jgi:LmbE family N-acetylglucosaminyl deacetylase
MVIGLIALLLLASAAPAASVLAVFAHPDDETIVGAMLAKYAAEGHQVHLITFTSGQKGAPPHSGFEPGDALGVEREKELRCSVEKLGLTSLTLGGMQDQGLSDPRTMEVAASRLRELVEQRKPDVLVTWGPDGVTGHPDHRAASNIATQVFQQRSMLKHHPRKLYYIVLPDSVYAKVPADKRRPFRTVDDSFVTTVVDAGGYAKQAYAAVQCHKTQWTPAQMLDQKQFLEQVREGKIHLRAAFGASARENGLLDAR